MTRQCKPDQFRGHASPLPNDTPTLESDPLLPSLLGLLHLLDRLDRVIPLSSVLLLPFFEHDHDLAVDPAPSVLFDVLQTGKPVQVAPVGEDQVYHTLQQDGLIPGER